jgi:hypothetical protein
MKLSLWILGVVVGIAALAAPYSPSSVSTYWIFNLMMGIMLGLVFVRPYSYAYSFLAIFFCLGFQSKFIIHIFFGQAFIEPTGLFNGSVQHWDAALIASASAAAGIFTARVLHLAYLRWRSNTSNETLVIPWIYIHYRKSLWLLTLAAILIIAIWNKNAAIYQIGVNPKVVLPLHLNVLLAWLINWGFALWLACLVYWEQKYTLKSTWAIPIAVIFEGAAMGISSLSRSAYFFHALAGLIPWVIKARRHRLFLISYGLVSFIFMLAFTLYVVQILRADTFLTRPASQTVVVDGQPNEDASAMKLQAGNRGQMLEQTLYLFFSRWTGLEGILAVSSFPSKGFQLFKDGLNEDPRRGIDSIYQQIAGSKYKSSEDFTFLTLAGIASIFYYSDSFTFVFFGMVLVALLILFIEVTANKMTKNPYILSIAGVAMAYTITQTTYPYLSAIFLLELIFTITAFAIVARIKFPSKKNKNL